MDLQPNQSTYLKNWQQTYLKNLSDKNNPIDENSTYDIKKVHRTDRKTVKT